MRVVCRPSFHTLWGVRLCPLPGGMGTLGPETPLWSRGRENRGPDWISKERFEEEHPSLLVGLKSDHSMAKCSISRCPKQAHQLWIPSRTQNRTRPGEETQYRPWRTTGKACQGGTTKYHNVTAWRSRGGYSLAPPVTEEETPQQVNLSWVTQGRATPGTRAPLSQLRASPCRSSHQLPHPVPVFPRGSPPSTAVSSPGSEQLLESHPPTSCSWEKGKQVIRGD